MRSKLKPCINCGCENIKLFPTYEYELLELRDGCIIQETDFVRAACIKCGISVRAKGVFIINREVKATIQWNQFNEPTPKA